MSPIELRARALARWKFGSDGHEATNKVLAVMIELQMHQQRELNRLLGDDLADPFAQLDVALSRMGVEL